MQRTFLPALTDTEAEAARQLADVTGLPLARIIRLVTRPFWQSRFSLLTYSAAEIRAWSDRPGQRQGTAPIRHQQHLRDFAACLIEDEPCSGPSPSH